MPETFLLLRESLSTSSLTSIVAQSQSLRPPFSKYNLNINASQLDITLITPKYPLATSTTKEIKDTTVIKTSKQLQLDEGFESDIDSISLVSSDDSFTSSTCLVDDHVLKHRENDSANGSSSGESDNEIIAITTENIESYLLNDVICYTDVNYPNVLVFVIKNNVLVFSFGNINVLQSFYNSFNTLKAVTNQRAYGVNPPTSFNLLQRTDQNGITHIEISREPQTKLQVSTNNEASSIISLNTPEGPLRTNTPPSKPHSFRDDSKLVLPSESRSSRSEFYPHTSINSYTLRPKTKSTSLVDDSLKKVWKSAENLLDSRIAHADRPERPERRRRPKGRAPPPPTDQHPQNIMKGQYIRVAVDPKKSHDGKTTTNEIKSTFHTFASNLQTFTPNWNNLRSPQSPLILATFTKHTPKQISQEYKLKHEPTWTNSVPRLLKKSRSKSETRQPTPMAYRYIDTTSNKPQIQYNSSSQTISNRLFGLSQRLKEFGNNVVSSSNRNFNFYDGGTETRRNSLGEMTYKTGYVESNLKSVIKKQDDKKNKSGEKKVTFSAYTTVQVV